MTINRWIILILLAGLVLAGCGASHDAQLAAKEAESRADQARYEAERASWLAAAQQAAAQEAQAKNDEAQARAWMEAVRQPNETARTQLWLMFLVLLVVVAAGVGSLFGLALLMSRQQPVQVRPAQPVQVVYLIPQQVDRLKGGAIVPAGQWRIIGKDDVYTLSANQYHDLESQP
jgi:hypothetical protein